MRFTFGQENSRMKTYLEILNNKDDGAIALDLFDRGFPECVYSFRADGLEVGIGWLFLTTMRLEGAIVCNGFCSIFDQTLAPWEIEDFEKFFSRIGAHDFLEHFQECRRIYFGSGDLPKNNEEWSSFRSEIWLNPEGPESTRFDLHADKAEKAYYGDDVPGVGYIDMHKKLGAYFREHLKSFMSEADFLK